MIQFDARPVFVAAAFAVAVGGFSTAALAFEPANSE